MLIRALTDEFKRYLTQADHHDTVLWVAHELRALLPRLAARSVSKGRAFWEYNLANLERVRETLLGNFDDTLLRFLARPRATLNELRQEKLDLQLFPPSPTTVTMITTGLIRLLQ